MVSSRSFHRPGRDRVGFQLGLVAVTAVSLVGLTAVSAQAALPSGPTTTGVTGSRPSATNLSFPITDRVSARVDVADGNLLVTTNGLSLIGENGTIPIGASYNSRGWQTSASNAGLGNGWTANFAGAGSLATTSAGVVLTQADGSTWVFTPGTTTGTYVSPAGLTSTLTSTSTSYTLTELKSRQVTKFDGSGRALSVTDKNGNETDLTYNSSGVASVTAPAGPTATRSTNLTFDPYGNYVLTQGSGGSTRAIKYGYNSSTGNVSSFTDATGKVTSFGYTGSDLTTITSPTGAVTNISYSGTTHKVAEVDQQNTTAGSPGTSTTRLTYPSASQTLVAGPNTDTSVAVATGPHTTYDLNATQALVNTATDPQGRQRSKSYNANSLPLTSTSGASGAAGSTTSTAQYNANGNNSLTNATTPGGTSSTATYSSTNPNTAYLPQDVTSDTGSGPSTTTLHYTGFGNVDSSSTGSGATLAEATLTYNTDGTVATATAPGNGTNQTVYGYNANHQLSTITPVTGTSLATKSFTYDDFGRVKTETDGASHTTTYTYDNNDRTLTTAFSDATGTVTDTYDAAGHLLTEASAPGTVTNTYDQLGRLTSTVNSAGGGTVSYGYDQASNQTSLTTSYGTWTNTFDASGVLLVTKYPKGSAFQYADYATDNQGRRTDTFLQGTPTYANTTPVTVPTNNYAGRSTTSYDVNGRVSEVKAVTKSGSTLTTTFDTQYCYNSASTTSCSTAKATDHSKIQWSKDLTPGGSLTAYAYDGSGRVLTATQTGGTSNTTWTYTYDLRGNRTSAKATGAITSTQSLAYNAANQITTAGYSYDGGGNLTATPTATYTYNAAEQMITSKNTSSGIATNYTYAGAAENAVLSETSASGATYNITYGGQDANGQPEIVKYSSNGNTGNLFADPTTGQASLLTTSSDIATLYVYDGLANPVGLITDFSTNSVTSNFDPYGVGTLNGTGNGVAQNPYSFHSGIQDRASGLVKFGIRWYNPTTGTWTQQDTFDAPLDPTNGNRYVFVGGDPINGIDPTGLFCGATAAAGVGFGALALGTAATGIGAPLAIGFGVLAVIEGVGSLAQDC